MTKVDPTTKLMLDRYWALCAQRDAANADAAPYMKELGEINAEIERLRLHSLEVKGDVEACRDGAAWLTLKSEISRLAGALKFTPPPGSYE